MKKIVRSNLQVKCTAITLMLMLASAFVGGGQAQSVSPERLPAYSQEDDAVWQRVTLDEEEISILTPVSPTVIVQSGDHLFFKGSDEEILEERKYSGYSNGFIFAIESYKVKNPQNLLKDMLDKIPTYLRHERDLTLDGFSGKQYRMSGSYGGQVYYFAASKHVYVITLAVSDEANPSLTRFFSSLRLGDRKGAAATNARTTKKRDPAAAPSAGVSDVQASNQEQTFSPKQVTRKATIIWRPPPIYTEEARQNQVNGTVVLRAVFSSSGYVTNIKVVSGLADGLTERAIEAARSIRFFPAVKDGKFVSQYIQIEYNFNLY
jgi:TonB family protein